MTQIREKRLMPPEIFGSRPRLIAFCRSLTGEADSAEDLAQETLAEAWRCRDGLRDPNAAEAWLFGIARNVCRRHLRRTSLRYRLEASTEIGGGEASTGAWEALEQEERAALLDQAISLLPETARAVLAARYWDEMPLAEIAARSGCTENAAAVRLGRARESLRQVLETRLREEASPFGLAPEEPGGWRQTRVWCFRCGERRLEERRGPEAFGVRCPQCDSAGGDVAFSTRHAAMNTAEVLGPVRACKPALRRVNAWWDLRLRRGLSGGTLACWHCAGTMRLRPQTALQASSPHFPLRAVFECGGCGADFSLPASGLAFHSAEMQRFWQRHPRLRVLPERRIEIGRKSAIIAHYQAVGGTASMEIVYDAVTFQQWKVLPAS